MLSIVIVNWKTCGHLRRCLQSLETHGLGEEMQVIVVDNASGDGSADMVRDEFPKVHLIALDKNVGYAEGNNVGIAAALNTTGVEPKGRTSDSRRSVLSSEDMANNADTVSRLNTTGVETEGAGYILTLNPDVEFFDDSLRTAVDEIRTRPDVGAMGIRLVDPDGVTTQASIRSFPRPSAIIPEMLGLSRLLPTVFGQYRMHGFGYSKSQEVEQPMGTFVLYRVEALHQSCGEDRTSRTDRTSKSNSSCESYKTDSTSSPFDPQFPIFFNEVDLLQRIANAGWKILYCADARLKHHGGASTRQVRKPMIWESHRSLVRYYRKWYYRWWNAPLFWLFAGLVYLGAFVRARGFHAGFRP